MRNNQFERIVQQVHFFNKPVRPECLLTDIPVFLPVYLVLITSSFDFALYLIYSEDIRVFLIGLIG